MNQARELALGVIADLRARRLLPVAALLVVMVAVLPVVLHKPAEEPAAAPAPTAKGAPASVGGLPGPEQALSDAQKPLVTLATLERPSNLQTYKGRNPFKPLTPLTSTSTSGASSSASSAASADGSTSPAAGSGSGTGSTGSTGSGGGGSGGGSGSAPPATTPAPQTETKTKTKVTQFTYVLDAKLRTPFTDRSYRNLQRLSMLPSQSSPLLIFLGVSDGGNSAIFLVDSALTAVGGEAHCRPTHGDCATLRIAPGETYTFMDAAGRHYVLELEQINRISVAELRKRNAKKSKKSTAHAAATGARKPVSVNDFVPVLVDLVTGGQR